MKSTLTDETILTAHEDFQFAEVCMIEGRKLENNVSVRGHVAPTLQVDGGAQWYGARILTTHVVLPQCRRSDAG